MATVAEVIADTLKAYDTDHFFCVTGGDHALWIALRDAGIRIINCRSESAAVYMADGYARVSGRPGFVYGQKGPGAANVAAALADPGWAMSPVISLTSATSLSAKDRFEYQELDAIALHAPLTSWSKSVMLPERTAQMLRAAIRIATGPPSGPVHLEFPQDVLNLEAGSLDTGRDERSGTISGLRSAPTRDSIRTLLEHLSRADRPVIIAGGGVIQSSAWEELTAFAETFNIPVATSLGGKGSIDEGHDLSVGIIGRYSRKVANDVVNEADVVLAIGTRLGGLVTNGWKLIGDNVKVLQIDNDAHMLGYNYRPTWTVLGDAREALTLCREEATSIAENADSAQWAKAVTGRVATWREEFARLAESELDDGIHPASVMADLRTVLGPNDLVAGDTGSTAAWTGALFPIPAGRRYLRSAGSLGWVVPGAMGAALADPSRRTVAVSGDGGMGYHIGELETALRCDIPIVIVIMNNRCFASEYHSQEHHWNNIVPEVCDFWDAPYGDIAKAFGAFGTRVTDRGDVADAIKSALASGGPAVVEVLTSKEAIAPTASYDSTLGRVV